MTTYLAFLRGINVGGTSLIKMADLRASLTKAGLENVRTYIQSGNVLFEATEAGTGNLETTIAKAISRDFGMDIAVAVFSAAEWQSVIAAAPAWWGQDQTWKHNILIMTTNRPAPEVIAAIGQLKPDIETAKPGNRVVYQSLCFTSFGRTTGGKLASNPVYKELTIRNYNTATKLAALCKTY